MAERARSNAPRPADASMPLTTAAAARREAQVPPQAISRALAIQRTAGNRALTRMLARWAADPDQNKKGALMPDAIAAEYNRFNPPLST